MALLLFKRDADGAMPISIVNLTNGNVLKTWKQPCHRNRRIECINLVGERFVFKQEGLPMQVYDVRAYSAFLFFSIVLASLFSLDS